MRMFVWDCLPCNIDPLLRREVAIGQLAGRPYARNDSVRVPVAGGCRHHHVPGCMNGARIVQGLFEWWRISDHVFNVQALVWIAEHILQHCFKVIGLTRHMVVEKVGSLHLGHLKWKLLVDFLISRSKCVRNQLPDDSRHIKLTPWRPRLRFFEFSAMHIIGGCLSVRLLCGSRRVYVLLRLCLCA